MDFNLENPLSCYQELPLEIVLSLFHGESEHMPGEDYIRDLKKTTLKDRFRSETVSFILQVSQGFDPFLQYLSINYLDRFLSIQRVPHSKTWIKIVLAVACVSLAAKMTQTSFLLPDIQGDESLVVDVQTLNKMEITILGVLKWRMRSITPFSFVDFFVSLLKLKDPPLMEELKAQAFDFIINSQNDIELLEFKPSIIAASAIICASQEILLFDVPSFKECLSKCSFVNTASMVDCFSRMKDATMARRKSMKGSDEATLVKHQCLFPSDCETGNERSVGRDLKRRKLGGLLWQSDGSEAAFSDPPAASYPIK